MKLKKIKGIPVATLLLQPIAAPGSQVLSQWCTDKRFCDGKDNPRDLFFDEGENTFSDLVGLYAGDIPAGAMRTELVRMGIVEVLKTGKLRAKNRFFMPTNVDEKLAMSLRDIVRPCLIALDNNCNEDRQGPLFVQSVAAIEGLNPKHLPKIRRELRQDLREKLGILDTYLIGFSPDKRQKASKFEAGVGIFYYDFEDSDMP